MDPVDVLEKDRDIITQSSYTPNVTSAKQRHE